MLFRFPRKTVPLRAQLKLVIQIFLLVSAVELINLLTGRSLNSFGIIPRTMSGLYGIATAPFIHGNSVHFASNLLPLLLFSALMLEHGRVRFWLTTVGVILLGGGAVWLFGRAAVHIGASGLIFGYFGFLVTAGIISRELKLLFIAGVVGFFYSGILWGVIPSQSYVSFESHLFGLLAGMAIALLIGSAKR
ncbi:MAG: rhomboid family intramembrane serine protease [Reinekea sp.]|nr:rhomboid family intramembrane serine protease [Reinekea sp.]